MTGLAQGASTSTTMIDLVSEEPKVKRRGIKQDANFKTKVIQKKEKGTSTSELTAIFKSKP